MIDEKKLTQIKIDNDTTVSVIKSKLLSKFDDKIVHGFSTRLGGVSKDHLSSMNLSFSRGDERDNVLENHRRFAKALGYDEKKLVFSDQVHKDHIRICTEEDAGKGIIIESDIKETDGLMTEVKGLPLITFFADCVPLLFYAPDINTVAAVHSGWKGTFLRIGPKTVKLFRDRNADISKLICYIGPSICGDCYEIGPDTAENFMDFNDGIILRDNHNGKYNLSLQKAIRKTLIKEGMKEENIEISDICTACNSDILFSHRKTNGKRGNLAAVIMLKQ